MKLKITILMAFMLVLSTSVISQQSMTVTLDAQDTDIVLLLSSLAGDNEINLVLSDSVKGNVSVSLKDVTPIIAVELILNANGFVLQKVGNAFIAGKEGEVTKYLAVSTKIINLKHAIASDLTKTLSGIAMDKAQVQADARMNSIIISGPESVVQELERFIALMDVELPPESKESMTTKVFMLENVQASSLHKIVTNLVSPMGQVGMDDITNSLVVTDIFLNIDKLTEIVAQLDVESPYMAAERARKEQEAQRAAEMIALPSSRESGLETRVFILNHVEATAIKEILEASLSSRGKIHTFLKQKEGLAPIQLSASASRGGSSEGGQSTTSSCPKLETEKWSDTLIITDEASVLDGIDALLKKLDVKTPQVKIEARLVEISTDSTMDLGIEWNALDSSSDSSLTLEKWPWILLFPRTQYYYLH